ncbi:SMP-30/gluconolactonase/LRE family protein [Paraburkholderia caballeronis]|uniref:Sugar lactone lactonase YvrE n=1 Tax=Paraburkholderia caballeronis TaxID=416943 RepID=A0A1H7H7U4_9BURK|nr:SMP-30/gluconolactonase/LRE family protein [Paraburkholderia caballeronis]PXW29614.1 sugar lactone lactonase YvrE [Paraburkholderia caballeronis]PXX04873.1 sugar lactone lactonase YvrE [Paraburkholderia caballeronis]RAK05934.1 sugar lactone lactonase YvrE [Paraburkholderia caballeronis]SEB44119.1 Sugar lactone lactonase YvrE [Paraburkholderia caballeronis]SEK46364.1 Sugar lactone lactonase YvrE [Paraburkholderia caballeronis]
MPYPLPPDFKLTYSDLRISASGLTRPECVLALHTGDLIAAHGKGGYTHWRAGAEPRHVLPADGNPRKYVPNGIALSKRGTVLFANLGSELGGIFSIAGDGTIEPVVETVDGAPLPPTNFVVEDNAGAIWFTVSTRMRPRAQAWTRRVTDGFIGVSDTKGSRILADGLGYTNEIAFSPDRKWVYVNETYAQKVSRFELLPGPALGPKEVVCQLGGADFPDGLCFDAFGGVWITCVGSNRVIVVRPDGTTQIVLEDLDAEYTDYLASRYAAHALSVEDMATTGKSRLKSVSSLVFGGPDMKTAYLGCLLGDAVLSFDSPIAGAPTTNSNRSLR